MKPSTNTTKAIALHNKLRGKIVVASKAQVTKDSLSLLYTPGVAAPCLAIQKDENLSYNYTARGNMIAVISDGTAVLGLGNIGPLAGMPVMEGKCILFKTFGGVDAFPLCLSTQDTQEIIKTIVAVAPSFGGINLEDISAPRCFEIERALKERLDIPIFHDDQHGTAVIVLAGLINALKITHRSVATTKIVVNGAGAAGLAVTEFLVGSGFTDIIVCDSKGVLPKQKTEHTNPEKLRISKMTNPRRVTGTLADAMKGADVFIGVSCANVVSQDMVRSMNKKAIIFALANPVPEIMPEDARNAGAAIVGTGRSDYPNQINNVLAFPGIMRGALAVRSSDINEAMKRAASIAIADMVSKHQLSPTYVIPGACDMSVGPRVARAVAAAAMKSGVARIHRTLRDVEKETGVLINEHKKYFRTHN